MKPLLFAAALLAGTAAFAQPASPPTLPGGPESAPPAADAPPSPPADAAPPPPPADGPSASGSAQSTMPAQGAMPPASAATAAAGEYPRCSRGVKDKCVQGGSTRRRR